MLHISAHCVVSSLDETMTHWALPADTSYRVQTSAYRCNRNAVSITVLTRKPRPMRFEFNLSLANGCFVGTTIAILLATVRTLTRQPRAKPVALEVYTRPLALFFTLRDIHRLHRIPVVINI